MPAIPGDRCGGRGDWDRGGCGHGRQIPRLHGDFQEAGSWFRDGEKLARFGYRAVLISNTIMIGLMICVFSTVGVGTPLWFIVGQSFCYGFFSSLQYTSMNTLVYADVSSEQASMGSSIASTMQQMSISFGVATASLLAAVFIPDRFHSNASQMIQGIHRAFFVLGGITVLSTAVFRELKPEDGSVTSQHKVLEHAG